MLDPNPAQRRWIALAILVTLYCPLVALPGRAEEEKKEDEGPAPVADLTGHTEVVYDAIYTPDQQKLISGSGDKSVRVWDASQLLTEEDKKKKKAEEARLAAIEHAKLPWFWKRWWHKLFGPKEPTPAASASASGEPSAAGTVDEHHSAVRPAEGQAPTAAHPPQPSIWKRVFGYFSRTHELSKAMPTPAPTPTPRFTPVPAPSVEVSHELHTTITYPGQVLAVAAGGDSRTVIAGGDVPLIQIFDIDSGALLRTLKGHTDDIRSLAVSPDGRLLASASGDATVRIWDLASGKTLKVLHEPWLTHLSFSHNGKLLAASSGDPPGYVSMWEVGSWHRRYRLRTKSDLVYWVAFSHDDSWFVTAGEVQKVWHTADGKPVIIPVSPLELPPLEAIVAQAQKGENGAGAETGEEAPPPENTKKLELRGHDKYALTADVSVPVEYFQPPTPPKKRDWFFKRIWWWCCSKNPPPPVPDPTPPPPRTMPLIATGSIDNTVRIWDSTTGDTLATVKAFKGHVSSVHFNKTGSTLVSTSWDKSIKVWDVMKLIEPKIKEKLDREKLEQLVLDMREKQKKAAEEKAAKAKRKKHWYFLWLA